jgi:putative endonuclease
LAFVEVKARATLEEAQASITHRQSRRVRSAASLWLGRQPRLHNCEQRFDALYIIAGIWPHHVPAGA